MVKLIAILVMFTLTACTQSVNRDGVRGSIRKKAEQFCSCYNGNVVIFLIGDNAWQVSCDNGAELRNAQFDVELGCK